MAKKNGGSAASRTSAAAPGKETVWVAAVTVDDTAVPAWSRAGRSRHLFC